MYYYMNTLIYTYILYILIYSNTLLYIIYYLFLVILTYIFLYILSYIFSDISSVRVSLDISDYYLIIL